MSWLQLVLVVSNEEADTTEAETRCQYRSHLWFSMRAGRMTAHNSVSLAALPYLTPSGTAVGSGWPVPPVPFPFVLPV